MTRAEKILLGLAVFWTVGSLSGIFVAVAIATAHPNICEKYPDVEGCPVVQIKGNAL